MISKTSNKLLTLLFLSSPLILNSPLSHAESTPVQQVPEPLSEEKNTEIDYFETANPEFAEELVSDDDFYSDDYSDDRFFFSIETLLGGSTLERITFENGETDSVRAGSGVYLALGITHLMFDKQMDIGMKGGYLFDLVTASNDEGDKVPLSFTRKPIDFFSHAWFDRHCFGGGLSIHLNPVFKSRKTHHKANYKNALGVYAEYLYHFQGDGSALGIKYLRINYQNKKTRNIADGSGWGITFNKLI